MNERKASAVKTRDFREILDQAPFAVYVNALDSWELLYLNEPAKDWMNKQPCVEGATCFSLMGFSQPCPFCRVDKMNCDQLTIREYYHPILKRTFQLSGKLIDWNGVPAHLEYIVDVTEKKLADEASRALSDELQSVLRNIPGGLCVYRFDGVKISPVFHNDSFYDVLGYSDEHIFRTQATTENLNVHPDDVEELNRRIFAAIRDSAATQYTYRVYNDRKGEYRWIRLDGVCKRQSDGGSILYGLYTDVTEQRELELRLAAESERTQNIINAIPGGVAIYRVTDNFETAYFTDGVAELTGYSPEEYRKISDRNAIELVYPADRPQIAAMAIEAIRSGEVRELDFRKVRRDGHIVWVHAQAKKIGEENGIPLIQCVFHNITALKETQQELDHLVNSIPGGIEICRIENGRFGITYYTDGILRLTGYTREEFDRAIARDVMVSVFVQDRARVRTAAFDALHNGTNFELSYRLIHKDGHPVWVHLNGKRMGGVDDKPEIYAVVTGMSAETKLYQNIANETADGIYVIDRNNYDLLYVNESVRLFMSQNDNAVGKKCYAALHGRKSPCEFCSRKSHPADGVLHEMRIPGSDRVYNTRFRETDWNGIPAFIKFVSDVTEEEAMRKKKEQLEQYFQTMIKNLPGGVAVVRLDERTGGMIPEYMSEGFLSMCGMTEDEAWDLYGGDSCSGVHPDDVALVKEGVAAHLGDSTPESFELIYRLRRGDGSYFWVKNTSTLMITSEGKKSYSSYSDITPEIDEQNRIRGLYNEMLLEHHRSKDPNLILAGHCSLSGKRIMRITDRTDSDLLGKFGEERDSFFTGLSTLIVDEAERKAFLAEYLTEPLLASFERGETKHESDCFIRLPDEVTGRYVHVLVNLIKSPDTGDIIGVLSVLDYTERRISDRILHRLAQTNYDFIADVDLIRDAYKLLSYDKNSSGLPAAAGSYSGQAKRFLSELVAPKDRALCEERLDESYIRERLKENGSYSFHYTIIDDKNEMFTKNMIVFYIDKRLDRICLARTDITESIREQRQLLKILAYTFDLACFIDVPSRSFTMHTCDTVLQNLPPYVFESYDDAFGNFVASYGTVESMDDLRGEFSLDRIVARLAESPKGYEFIFAYRGEEGILYKQVNVLWGEESRRTICMVRADVTEIITSEQQKKEHLKNALNIAQEANRAKTDFLSAMSHDIRTPMNAIVGMTDLAIADRNSPAQIDESLAVIKSSSEHLLHLINDILDMSRIESGRMSMIKEPFSHAAELSKTIARAEALAEQKKIQFTHSVDIRHDDCIGDALRIQQILDNLLGNAMKFTPEGGSVTLEVVEMPPKNERIGWYRFVVSDTGIGMDEDTEKRVFEPFYRASAPNLKLIEGTGLGLSIVKNIVDYKGGVINVESAPGKGSRFTVDLPLHFSESATVVSCEPAKTEEDGSEDLGGARILLVEDHPVNQLVARRILEKMNARVTVCENGKEGYETFAASAAGEFAAICMDIQMPVMDGYQSTLAIRACAHPQAKSVPIVAMTANAFAGDVKHCLDVGMNAHIAKPIEPGKLYQLLCSFVRK